MTNIDTDTATAAAPPQTDRITRRDLAEGKVEKVLSEKTSLVPMGDVLGGLKFENMMQVAEAAKIMSTAGPMLPPWLQGNVGGCWAIIIRSTELGISPLTLANWSYVVENKGVARVGYESQFYHALVEARAPITTRLNHEIIGTGDDQRCRVWATFKGDVEERSLTSEPLGKLRPERNQYGKVMGSPLWERKPEVQLFYDTSRDWARIYCPEILGGVYARDELETIEGHVGFDNAKDVSPRLAERLRGPGGEGFAGDKIAEHVNATLNAARDTTAPRKKTAGHAGGEAAGPKAPPAAAPETAVGADNPDHPASKTTAVAPSTAPAAPDRPVQSSGAATSDNAEKDTLL